MALLITLDLMPISRINLISFGGSFLSSLCILVWTWKRKKQNWFFPEWIPPRTPFPGSLLVFFCNSWKKNSFFFLFLHPFNRINDLDETFDWGTPTCLLMLVFLGVEREYRRWRMQFKPKRLAFSLLTLARLFPNKKPQECKTTYWWEFLKNNWKGKHLLKHMIRVTDTKNKIKKQSVEICNTHHYISQ